MTERLVTVGERLPNLGEPREQLTVRLSKEIITLLSEQLYQSPLKAIEELVVNSFDADAPHCYVVVPAAAPGTDTGRLPVIAVYDDGVGMDEAGLEDLWRIGISTKRDELVETIRKRRQIGKFGIGKLATYALANRITYLTSVGQGEALGLSLQFTDFRSDAAGPETPVTMSVRALGIDALMSLPWINDVIRTSKLDPGRALDPSNSWTLVLLEELKDKALKISPNRLRWVLRTAMPLSDGFSLFLNSEPITSSKLDFESIVDFTLDQLPAHRLENLKSKTGLEWRIEDRSPPTHPAAETLTPRALVCEIFDEGVFGRVIVTKKSLYGGKSADLTRSHGFFVRVRGRLVDEDDPLSGLESPRSYETFNRFRADIYADDLDRELTAPREGLGVGQRRAAMVELQTEVFNEARTRYLEWEREQAKPQARKREEDRNYVPPRQVERPIADALRASEQEDEGLRPDADETWFYLSLPGDTDIDDLTAQLYDVETRKPFKYKLESLGPEQRMVRFLPTERTFVLNEDHALVLAYRNNPIALDLLYDLATAEALLEVYLREVGLAPHIAGEILERRDSLFKNLAQEHVNSPSAIAANLRGAVAAEHDLEIALVVAARALGFVAKHISGSDQPDGLARLRDYPSGERKIILEAKSSGTVPSLGAIDFAGLARHMKDHGAQGCLLIAPDYPGAGRANQAAAAKSAEQQKISCWTIEQLARVVEAMDTRDITARQTLDIVLAAFTPSAVTREVERLLTDPTHAPRELARALVNAFRSLEQYAMTDKTRSLDMLQVAMAQAGVHAPEPDVREALKALMGASQGALTRISKDRVRLNTSVEELERRVAPWLGTLSSARRASTFREPPVSPETA